MCNFYHIKKQARNLISKWHKLDKLLGEGSSPVCWLEWLLGTLGHKTRGTVERHQGKVTENVTLPVVIIQNPCPCLIELKSLTLPCLSHRAINLCWQGAVVLLLTASGGQSSTQIFFFFLLPRNKAGTASACCYLSLLIMSDNTLVTVTLTINHIERLWNLGGGWRDTWWMFVLQCVVVGHIVCSLIHWLFLHLVKLFFLF